MRMITEEQLDRFVETWQRGKGKILLYFKHNSKEEHNDFLLLDLRIYFSKFYGEHIMIFNFGSLYGRIGWRGAAITC